MAYDVDEPEQRGGAYLDPKVVIGHLLAVWAVRYIEHSPTVNTKPGQKSDVVVVDGVDLDQLNDQGEEGLIVRGSWWRQSRLIMLLKNRVGMENPVLIRITKGAGFTSPYEPVSQRSDPAAMTRFRQWAERNPDFVPTSPDLAEGPPTMGPGQTQQRQEVRYSGPGPQQQIPETPLEAQARLAQGQQPTSVVLERLRGMGRNHRDEPQSDQPGF